MRYAHILARVTDTPWLITEQSLSAITQLLEARILSGVSAVNAAAEDEPSDPIAIVEKPPGIAVISVRGILGKHLSMMEMMCGGCDFDLIARLVDDAAHDPEVRAIVLHLDSPGGTAVGCAETFARLNAIRESSQKEIYAFCDTKACSAAYYLAAACDGIYCTTTASLGCIGSMLTIEDRSGELAAKGIRRLTIKSASMKDIGNPDRPPSPAELSELQQRIDFLGAMFKRDVQAGRENGVAAEVFEKGLTYFGEQAVAVGLADHVVPSLDAFVAELEARFDTPAAASSR